MKQRIAHAGQWFGETLIADDALRASLNGHLEQAAHRVAPEFAAFLTRHISDTVKSWDARDMSRQIELNIGKDLQFIRVNGTLVGGTIRLVLYLLSQLPSLLPHCPLFKEKKWLTLPFPWRSATVCAMRSETTAAIISNWSWNSSTLSLLISLAKN